MTEEFLDDGTGQVRALRVSTVEQRDGRFVPVAGSERDLPADVVMLALGFTGPEAGGFLDQLGLRLDGRGVIARNEHYRTAIDGVFIAGDAGRGQSLIVWAIAEGRAAAAAVDEYLVGSTNLPAPIAATARPLMA